MQVKVEWFSPFCDFRKATRFCQSAIFLGGQFQKIGEFRSQHASHAHQSLYIFTVYIQYKYIYMYIYILQSSAQPTEQTQQVSHCIWFSTLLSRLYEIRTLRVIQTQKAMQQYGLINRSEYSNPYLFSLATGLGTAFFCVLNASFFGVLLKNATFFHIIFCEFFATYETQNTDAFFSQPFTTKNEKFADFRETSTACFSWYAEFRTFRIFEIQYLYPFKSYAKFLVFRFFQQCVLI